MSVIILSNPDDVHISWVAKHLKKKPILIDFQAIADRGHCSYQFDKGRLRLTYNGLDIESISGVWLRRPTPARDLTLPVSAAHRVYAESALKEFTDACYALFPDSVWVSDYYAILRAKNKPWQQAVAKRVGFKIPATLYTADAQEARFFCEKYAPIVVKSLATHFPPNPSGKLQGFFTRLHAAADDISFTGLNLAPAIFQAAIDVRREFRITVVGEQVFTAEVEASDSDRSVRDWRFAHLRQQCSFKSARLPRSITQKCQRLTRDMGLCFGAIDLIQDNNGVYWFLEINPNGQWAFVEEATGQPIGKTLARLLEGKSALTRLG